MLPATTRRARQADFPFFLLACTVSFAGSLSPRPGQPHAKRRRKDARWSTGGGQRCGCWPTNTRSIRDVSQRSSVRRSYGNANVWGRGGVRRTNQFDMMRAPRHLANPCNYQSVLCRAVRASVHALEPPFRICPALFLPWGLGHATGTRPCADRPQHTHRPRRRLSLRCMHAHEGRRSKTRSFDIRAKAGSSASQRQHTTYG